MNIDRLDPLIVTKWAKSVGGKFAMSEAVSKFKREDVSEFEITTRIEQMIQKGLFEKTNYGRIKVVKPKKKSEPAAKPAQTDLFQ